MTVYPASGVTFDNTENAVDVATVNCMNELFYNTSRCQPRFDPAAMNAMISEILNLATCGDIPYDCSVLDNLCTSVRNLADRATRCLTELTAEGVTPANGIPRQYVDDTVTPSVLNIWDCTLNGGAGGYFPIAFNAAAPNQFSINTGGGVAAPGDAAFQLQFSRVPQDEDQVCAVNDSVTPVVEQCYQRIGGAWVAIQCCNPVEANTFNRVSTSAAAPTDAAFLAAFGRDPAEDDKFCTVHPTTDAETCYYRNGGAWVPYGGGATTVPLPGEVGSTMLLEMLPAAVTLPGNGNPGATYPGNVLNAANASGTSNDPIPNGGGGAGAVWAVAGSADPGGVEESRTTVFVRIS